MHNLLLDSFYGFSENSFFTISYYNMNNQPVINCGSKSILSIPIEKKQ
ncbi:hypothetical protein [Aquimarina hainanensis]